MFVFTTESQIDLIPCAPCFFYTDCVRKVSTVIFLEGGQVLSDDDRLRSWGVFGAFFLLWFVSKRFNRAKAEPRTKKKTMGEGGTI